MILILILEQRTGKKKKKKQFEIAVRDFKRGGQYMQDVKGPAFEKIWNEVLRIVEELRILLERILMESRLPVDAQERLIEFLFFFFSFLFLSFKIQKLK